MIEPINSDRGIISGPGTKKESRDASRGQLGGMRDEALVFIQPVKAGPFSFGVAEKRLRNSSLDNQSLL